MSGVIKSGGGTRVPSSLSRQELARIEAEDVRRRFLKEILTRIGVERVEELHLFAPIRQGGVESGVALVAVCPPAAEDPAPVDAAAEASAEDLIPERGAPPENNDNATSADDSHHSNAPNIIPAPPRPRAGSSRHTIYTGRYRLTQRGPDRGKWEFDLVEEADAPLEAVEAVVRGVHERSGEPTDCERISGDELRRMTADPAWNAAR